MKSAYELICHHTYAGWNGLPVDLSDYDSHGQAIDTQFLNDGARQGSGAIQFPLPSSRIRVPKSPASTSLTAIKVEVTVRRTNRLNRFTTLVAGHNSFSFFLVEDQLRATFRGKSTHPLATSDGLDAESDGVISPRWMMTLGNKWTTIGFLHDGIDTMELHADGQLIARRTGFLASVPPVGPLGISIGNEPDRNDSCFLSGDIDEVKIWRLDPSIMDHEFFARPMNKATIECWKRFFESLGKALHQNPDCARQISHTLAALMDGMPRAIMAKGPETRARYIKTCEQYQRLWRAGKLDSPEMAKLLADFWAWLELVGFSIKDDPAVKELLQSDCLKKVVAKCRPLDCDQKFLALVRHAIENGPKS